MHVFLDISNLGAARKEKKQRVYFLKRKGVKHHRTPEILCSAVERARLPHVTKPDKITCYTGDWSSVLQ
jgi:hypothetical protein